VYKIFFILKIENILLKKNNTIYNIFNKFQMVLDDGWVTADEIHELSERIRSDTIKDRIKELGIITAISGIGFSIFIVFRYKIFNPYFNNVFVWLSDNKWIKFLTSKKLYHLKNNIYLHK